LTKENRNEEYSKLNPLGGSLPFYIEGELKIAESAAILRYLATTHKVDEHWYPKDLNERIKIDMYLDWHHTNTRRITSYFVEFLMKPKTG